MPVTYSGNPATSSRDAVRFLLRDTSTATADFQDAEVDWLVAEQSNVYKAAAMGARTKAAENAEAAASQTVGSLTQTFSERATKWLSLAESLESQANRGLGSAIQPYSGGISETDKEATADEADFDKPYFYRGMHDNPGADSVEYSYPVRSTG